MQLAEGQKYRRENVIRGRFGCEIISRDRARRIRFRGRLGPGKGNETRGDEHENSSFVEEIC